MKGLSVLLIFSIFLAGCVPPETSTPEELVWYYDGDNDGYGDAEISLSANEKPAQYVANNTDCNDDNDAINPEGIDIVSGVDEDCDGNINNDFNYVFTTSESFSGNLGGYSGADQKCQTLADASSKMPKGVYKAWLSNAFENAGDRLTHASTPYVRYDNNSGQTEVIANDWTDLTDGLLSLSLARNENGEEVINALAWTGTTKEGWFVTGDPYNSCWNWTEGTGDPNLSGGGPVGNVTMIDETWSWEPPDDELCNVLHRLYCFQQ